MNGEQPELPSTLLTELTAKVVAAYVGGNAVTPQGVADIIQSVHEALAGLMNGEPSKTGPLTPAVPVKRSIQHEYIVCLEDGKRLKMLKRYLRTRYGLSPADYRKKWGLPIDYPMVAPAYAKVRSDHAKEHGLGKRVPKTKVGKRGGR